MNNKVLIGVIVGVVVLAFGGYLIFGSRNTQKTNDQSSTSEEQTVRELKPEDIGLTLTLLPDKKAFDMSITKLQGVSSITYEATYDAEVTEGGDNLKVGRGIGPSTIEVKPTDTEITRRNIALGTCSRNVCKYDKVVSDVTFNIRVNFIKGDSGSIKQIIKL